jgi:hypothetical protein
MVYKFDPTYFNGLVFLMDDGPGRAKGSIDYIVQNLPIPASYFVSRIARHLRRLRTGTGGFERVAPREVEFIPVQIKKGRTSWLNPIIDLLLDQRLNGSRCASISQTRTII